MAVQRIRGAISLLRPVKNCWSRPDRPRLRRHTFIRISRSCVGLPTRRLCASRAPPAGRLTQTHPAHKVRPARRRRPRYPRGAPIPFGLARTGAVDVDPISAVRPMAYRRRRSPGRKEYCYNGRHHWRTRGARALFVRKPVTGDRIHHGQS